MTNMDITSYLLEQLALLDTNAITYEQLVEELLLKLSTDYGLTTTDDLRQIVTNMVLAYQNKAITSEDFVSIFNSVTNSSSNIYEDTSSSSGSSHGGGGGSSKKSKSDDTKGIIVDIDTDLVYNVATKLTGIETEIEGLTIDVPSEISSYAANIETSVTTLKTTITTIVNDIKTKMQEVIKIVATLDDDGLISYEDAVFEGKSFEEIARLTEETKKNSVARKVDEEFFRQGGCAIEGDYAIFEKDGIKCRYNMKTHKFYVGDSEEAAFEAYFYVPSSVTDYSKLSELNTYTCFVQNDDKSKGYMDSSLTNTVVARITKFGGQADFTKYDETNVLTKFMNEVAHTDRTNIPNTNKPKCKNIIAGDSAYGSYALQIAANSGDTYDSVYCINFAATVRDENCGGKRTQFNSLDDLKKLDGKDIYFLSVTNDENFTHCYNGGSDYADTKDPSKSYTYTGLQLMIKYCPNSKIHMIYNENNTTNGISKILREDLTAYANGLGQNNYFYEPEAWYDFFNASYTSHGEGKKGVNDAAKAAATNYNYYYTQASVSDTTTTA